MIKSVWFVASKMFCFAPIKFRKINDYNVLSLQLIGESRKILMTLIHVMEWTGKCMAKLTFFWFSNACKELPKMDAAQ